MFFGTDPEIDGAMVPISSVEQVRAASIMPTMQIGRGSRRTLDIHWQHPQVPRRLRRILEYHHPYT